MPDASVIFRAGAGTPLYYTDPQGSYLNGAQFTIPDAPAGCTMFVLDSISVQAAFPAKVNFPDLPLVFSIGWASLAWSYAAVKTWGGPPLSCFTLTIAPGLVIPPGETVQVIAYQMDPGSNGLSGTYPEYVTCTWGGHYI